MLSLTTIIDFPRN